MQVPPQSSGVVPEHAHCPVVVSQILPLLQSLDVQHAFAAMHELVAAQYFWPPRHFPEQGAVCAMQAPSQS